MNILYGLCGEGMGHTTRSKVVIKHLRSKGHRVLVAASGRSFDVMKKTFADDVMRIEGFFLEYEDGALHLAKTLAATAVRMQQLLASQTAAFREVDAFAPEAVITDFEQFATFYATTRSLPLTCIGNHGVFTRCDHDPQIAAGTVDVTIRGYVWVIEPPSAHAIVTSITPLTPKPEYPTTMVPPILRAAVINAKPSDGEHVLVYQTSASDSRLLDALRAQPGTKFVVYGLGRNQEIGNCSLRTFDEGGFLRDLASAQAVIANGGYSLTSEAVALGKPIYSIPVRKHPEQLLNARYVQALGFGEAAEFVEPEGVASFLARAPAYARTLRSQPRHDSNEKLYRTLDAIFAPPTVTW